MAALLREVQQALPVPIVGVVSDGQWSIRKAVHTALPGISHQLCHFHYLREAAKPIYEADRHAKKELKKQVRGVRPIERALEGQLARRRGDPPLLPGGPQRPDRRRPSPLTASGLRRHERLQAVAASLERVPEKEGYCRS